MIRLVIPEATPSLNRLLHIHWHKKTQKRKHWLWLVRAARLEAKIFPTAPLQKAKVTITRHGRRICDDDNCIGGYKMLIDSLVREGILADDSPDHITLVSHQKVSKTPHTIVEVEAA